MSDRTYPYDPFTPCDVCHTLGSYDMMGDNLCEVCLSEEIEADPTQFLRVLSSPPLIYPQRSE